ncbi:MAG: hypothetical protein DWQ07_09930 [Chloroflexi bacterium]|nr:MAG: hypothetical protein DWQ07_09930 [Chloroflexota bacterium]MBL1192968.1 hypothetical protein [Chloroflexota bacterium]NOH10260.1 hypothetical protein [Chloroflexota bacterium]
MINRKPTRQQLLVQRYVLVGIALGLYIGLFFRPVREPNMSIALVLGVLATIVTVGFKAYREKRWPSVIEIGRTYIQFTLFLLVFEARHIAYDYGGRVAVSVFTSVAGGVIGYLMSRGRVATSGPDK